GYHVLCEKPVAVTRAEAVALATAASRAGRVVMPCHQYRFNPVWRRVKRWLDEGVIGRWYLADFRVYRLAADQGASSDVVRRRETEVRFIGERGSITWSGGTLTLERDGKGPAESFDHRAELDKASYATWFADLFCDFARALDSGDGAPHIADIAQVAAVLED